MVGSLECKVSFDLKALTLFYSGRDELFVFVIVYSLSTIYNEERTIKCGSDTFKNNAV